MLDQSTLARLERIASALERIYAAHGIPAKSPAQQQPQADAYPVTPGVPAPDHPRTTARRYPFGAMAVGDSFLIPAADLNAHAQASVRGSARHRGMRARTRREADGLRVWRVA